MKSHISLILLCLVLTGQLYAQENEALNRLSEDEQMVVEAIALYPAAQREAILLVSANPEIPVRLEKIQKNSEVSFNELIDPLDVSLQKQVYDISRYPELIREVTRRGIKRKADEMDAILAKGEYPESVALGIRALNKDHFEVLVGVMDLYDQSEAAFLKLVSSYDAEVQNAARSLVALPEVLTLLNENMGMTVLLGDIYSRDPAGLMHELDSLNSVLAEQNAKELNEWKESLENDPEAMKEYEQAAQEFAEEEGYDARSYNERVDVNTLYVYNYWRPYPYWFGYPYWYSYPYWYEYPWWYHWGYYYGPNHHVVIIGMPSTVFVHWHFSHYHHFYRYPHFTDHYFRHYHHHRRSTTSVTNRVRSWEREMTPQLPRDWTADDDGRVGRIEEYGAFRTDYEARVRESGGEAPSQRQFLEAHADRYPTMKPLLDQPEKAVPVTRPPVQRPVQEAPAKVAPRTRPDKDVIPPAQNPKEQENKKEIIRGWDYHNNTWDRQKRDTRAPERTTEPVRKPSAPARRDAPVQPRVPEKKQVPSKQAPREQKVQQPARPK